MPLSFTIECDRCDENESFDSYRDMQDALHDDDAWRVCETCDSITCGHCIDEGRSACDCDSTGTAWLQSSFVRILRSRHEGHPNPARALPAQTHWIPGDDRLTERPPTNTEPCPACGVVHYTR